MTEILHGIIMVLSDHLDIIFAQWVEGNEVEWSLGLALSEFAAEKGKKRRGARDVDER